jgi:hypothetical protein
MLWHFRYQPVQAATAEHAINDETDLMNLRQSLVISFLNAAMTQPSVACAYKARCAAHLALFARREQK